jgi:hypothetical protein
MTRRLPDATSLRLSLATKTEGRSRGATLSVATALARGGLEVRCGELRKRSIAFATWQIGHPNGPATSFAAVPRAELLAVHRSTAVPNIVTGIPMSRVGAAFVRMAGPWIGKAGRANGGAAIRRDRAASIGGRDRGPAVPRLGRSH